MNKNTGGPAFPHTVMGDLGQTREVCEGMSLRDYFAAHAPAEPQGWFKPVMQSDRPAPFVDAGGTQREEQFTSAAAMVSNKPNPAAKEWDEEYSRQWCIQWPYAWADAQLSERAK